MKYAVVGSRTFDDYAFMEKALSSYNDITTIISGGARGADSLAKKYALEHGLNYVEFPALWDVYGKSAGYLRNNQIVDAAEIVIAFWDGKSKGTRHTIKLASDQGKTVHTYWPDNLSVNTF